MGDDTVFIIGFRVNLEVHLGDGDDAHDSRFTHGRIHGTATIFGDNGDDVITSDGSGDQLYGGAGDDVPDGGNVMVDIMTRTMSAPASSKAADLLCGRIGDDIISLCEGHFGTGAAGADLFTADVFNPQPVSGGGATVVRSNDPMAIPDFQPGVDRIEVNLQGMIADGTPELVGVEGGTMVRFGTTDLVMINGFTPAHWSQRPSSSIRPSQPIVA